MNSASTHGLRLRRGSPLWRALVELLSSMRFAIALLTVLCVASMIGTVLRQQEPLGNYVNQFGPFWAQLFVSAQLHAVYSAWWFLLMLLVLVISTSLCVFRNTPRILAQLRDHKEDIRVQSLKAFGLQAQAALVETPQVAAQRIGGLLAGGGWRVRLQQRHSGVDGVAPGWMVAARAGGVGKLGYIAAHSAIVLICLGGLIDGDLAVRFQTWFDGKSPFRGGGLISQVPIQHRLAPTTPSFRGNVLVSEGGSASVAVLNQSDGVMLQPLPFSIELKKFIVDYYSTGMPRLFASEVLLTDLASGQTHSARIEVNHPAHFKGIEIYQSSFDDGGSLVKLKAMPMHAGVQPFEVQGHIGENTRITNGRDGLTLEFTALRVINVENIGDAGRGSGADVRKVDLAQSLKAQLGAANKPNPIRTQRNVGPSIRYKLRDASGQAREYQNYMLPVDTGDGLPVFLLGARDKPDDAFRYLHIPADDQGALDGFMHLRAALADPALREEAVRRYVALALPAAQKEQVQQLQLSATRALALFAGVHRLSLEPALADDDGVPTGGWQAVAQFIDQQVPQAERERAGQVLVRVLNGLMFELLNLSREQHGQADLPRNLASQTWLTQAVIALSDAFSYPAPVAMQLADFTQVQASVFQVTRAPGRFVVYLGCLLLILGIFAMLYVRERRLWVWLAPSVDGAQATMAMSHNRQPLDAGQEFNLLQRKLLAVAQQRNP